MVHLPAEILHQILCELVDGESHVEIAPLATVNRHWQGVVEGILWKRFVIHVGDVPTFNAQFRANPGRRKLLTNLVCFLDGYFPNPFAKKEVTPAGNSNEDRDAESGEEEDNEEHGAESVAVNEQPGQDWNTLNHGVILTRFSAFQNQHFRFFEELKLIWDELASWGEALSVTSIELCVSAQDIYNLLGPAFRDANVVQVYLTDDTWLDSPCVAQLPSLSSVKGLKVELDLCSQPTAALWPQIVACKLASTLPIIETLEASQDNDLERRWYHARKYFRETLAKQILRLPLSVRTVAFSLEFQAMLNHEIEPPNFLVAGEDMLSMSLRRLSTNLTTLAVTVNHITPSLFWDAKIPFSKPGSVLWPNLSVVDIRTGFETADGKYWMRPASTFPTKLPDSNYLDEDQHIEFYGECDIFDKSLGYWPLRLFRVRPEPELFDELAISIARAATCMPKLKYMNFEFDSYHRNESDRFRYEHFLSYEGWAFYFRANNEARFASKYFGGSDGTTHEPGPDRTNIERPRTEWVFQIPHSEVEWQEPEEAQNLWREKFNLIDLDLVTLDYDDETGAGTWERRRAGEMICRSTRSDEYLLPDEKL